MAVSREKLKTEINAILKDADLSVMSAKKVRQILEEKLSCNLSARKKEVDELVMDYVNSKDEGSESDDAEESEEEKPKRAPGKRPPPTKKPAPKRKGGDSDESESGGEAGSDDDYKPQKKGRGAPKGGKRKKTASESDSDEDWKAPKKPKKAGAGAGTGKKGKGTGFTRAYTLSPELAALMGAESLPRHEVVKKIWAMIKERNLYDPKNKQYAICDSDLQKVMGVKRFRTFGMLKYLREHFIN
ncbi:uncharacterized protein LOC129787770 [Lutzomyia longipalpis]|uniref:Putative rna polymerase i transcription factor uaf n=1 Tax=Lutzomyia longipalpis TaxID=7200 RepID=A0A1B0GKK2_LUTLO|nr:uncharacterized protein LOC129787770 [Lutzomyia longipalpis]